LSARQPRGDVLLVPLYTPIRTDENDVSSQRVFYGGVNVYLQQKAGLFRIMPRWLTRILDAPALLRRAMRSAGQLSPAATGALTVSILKGEHGAQKQELARLVDGLHALEPDVICLPNLMFVGLAAKLKAELRASVLCTLSGEDYFLDQLPEPYQRDAFRLIEDGSKGVDGFIAVTDYYASHAAGHFQLPADRVHVVPLGVNVDEFGEPA